MSVEITNTKSKYEKVIDNAGAVTGAKKSEYKFNDVTVTVPGSNLQVRIPPQQTHTFNVSENSIAGIALNNAKKELGLNEDGGDTPVESIIYVNIDTTTYEITCETPYNEIREMADAGNVKAITTIDMGNNTQLVVEYNTEVDDMYLKYMCSAFNSDSNPVFITDILFYGSIEMGGSEFAFPFGIGSDGWYTVETYEGNTTLFKENYDVFLLDYNDTDKLSLEKINTATDPNFDTSTPTTTMVMSANAINYLNGLFVSKGYKYTNYSGSSLNYDEYIALGQMTYYTQTTDYDNSTTNIATGFAYLDGENMEFVLYSVSLDSATRTITLNDTDFTVPDIPVPDIEFTLHSDKTITSIGSGNVEDKIGKLTIENIDGVTAFSPKISISQESTYNSDFTDLVTGNAVTFSNCVAYRFKNCYTVNNESSDIVVWYENSQWNVGRYYK